MATISSIYQRKDSVNIPKPTRRKPLTKRAIAELAATMAEQARLVSLVRSNGFPDCSSAARIAGMRKYLKSKRIKF